MAYRSDTIPLSEGLNQDDSQSSQVPSEFYVAAVVAFSQKKDRPPRVNTFPVRRRLGPLWGRGWNASISPTNDKTAFFRHQPQRNTP